MERNIFQKYPQVWWAGGAAVVLLVILIGLCAGWIYVFDWPITYAFAGFRKMVLAANLPIDISEFLPNFSSMIYVPSLLFCAGIMCALFKNKRLFLVLLINAVCIKILNFILKDLWQRPRPFQQDPSVWYINQSEFSFPSGHAMMAIGFFGLMIFIIWAYTRGKEFRVFWCIFLAVLTMLILVSRLYLSVHFASDVIGGACFSILWLCFYTRFIVPFFLGKPGEKQLS